MEDSYWWCLERHKHESFRMMKLSLSTGCCLVGGYFFKLSWNTALKLNHRFLDAQIPRYDTKVAEKQGMKTAGLTAKSILKWPILLID